MDAGKTGSNPATSGVRGLNKLTRKMSRTHNVEGRFGAERREALRIFCHQRTSGLGKKLGDFGSEVAPEIERNQHYANEVCLFVHSNKTTTLKISALLEENDWCDPVDRKKHH
jgi:hypothetical protein